MRTGMELFERHKLIQHKVIEACSCRWQPYKFPLTLEFPPRFILESMGPVTGNEAV